MSEQVENEMTSEGVVVRMSDGKPLMYGDKPVMIGRLPLSEVIPLSVIIQELVIEGGNTVLSRLYVVDWTQESAVEKTWSLILLSGMSSPPAAQKIMSMLARLMKISSIDFENAEKFPLYTLPAIIDALVRHPDLKRFFDEMRPLIKKNLEALLAHLKLEPKVRQQIKNLLSNI